MGTSKCLGKPLEGLSCILTQSKAGLKSQDCLLSMEILGANEMFVLESSAAVSTSQAEPIMSTRWISMGLQSSRKKIHDPKPQRCWLLLLRYINANIFSMHRRDIRADYLLRWD